VQHHVRVLEGLGVVRGVGEGQRRYFVAGLPDMERMQRQAEALSNPSTRAVYGVLSEASDCDLAAVCARLGVAKSTASEAATRLERAGLCERRLVAGRVALRRMGRPGLPVAAPAAMVAAPS
jgi:DNA-binding transcriptional ArsR family regulator